MRLSPVHNPPLAIWLLNLLPLKTQLLQLHDCTLHNAMQSILFSTTMDIMILTCFNNRWQECETALTDPIQDFFDNESNIFSIPNISDTEFDTFFNTKFFPIPNPIPFLIPNFFRYRL